MSANRDRPLLRTSLRLIPAVDRGMAKPLPRAMSPGCAEHGQHPCLQTMSSGMPCKKMVTPLPRRHLDRSDDQSFHAA